MLLFRGHTRFRRRLSQYLDGELPPAERSLLEAHLQSCAACQQELTGLRATVQALQALPMEPTPRSFRLISQQAIAGGPAGKDIRAPSITWSLATGGIAIALVFAVIGDFALDSGGTRQESGAIRTMQDTQQQAAETDPPVSLQPEAPPAAGVSVGDASEQATKALAPDEPDNGFSIGWRAAQIGLGGALAALVTGRTVGALRRRHREGV